MTVLPNVTILMQTAKLCGLKVKYVERPGHAFNAIKLDGHWYWLDVTFADTEQVNTMVSEGSATRSIPVGSTFIEYGLLYTGRNFLN